MVLQRRGYYVIITKVAGKDVSEGAHFKFVYTAKCVLFLEDVTQERYPEHCKPPLGSCSQVQGSASWRDLASEPGGAQGVAQQYQRKCVYFYHTFLINLRH